ncbi:MAG: hypothetical protein KDA84_22005 [Planctomycetaceae bacterium]|nr:hypothetical protein [Planctomycetaceae bacterium]
MSINTILHVVGNAWPEICDDPACPICFGSDRPPDGRGNTGVSLRGTDFHILVDFGQGTHAGIRRSNLPAPGLILATHAHPDHVAPMELDTLAKSIRDSGLASVPIVTTHQTWEMLPEFQRNQFRHIPIEPGHTISVDVGSETATVIALDASSHFRGGVVFFIHVADFSFGALFDLRDWTALDHSQLEDLDVAVIEANSLNPMSDKTGHVSIAEDIAFLNSLSQPPRLSLLTHYGHDDPVRHSQGSLVSLLQGLAPHLSVRMAYKGMVVPSTSLPPRNPVAILDDRTNLVVGVAEKKEAHERSLLHASVLILVCDHTGLLQIYERHERQSYPGCLDAFGGHMQPSDGGAPKVTAMREGTEEILLFARGGRRLVLEESWLRQIGPDYLLESTAQTNKERSTVFFVTLPEDVILRACDETDDGEQVELITHTFSLSELEELFAKSPGRFADGLARILQQMQVNPEFRAEVATSVERQQT